MSDPHIDVRQAAYDQTKLALIQNIGAKNDTKRALADSVSYLQTELEAAQHRAKQAEESMKEWRAAMEAWRDLAQALRDEVKACPNVEAHKFGKDDKARRTRFVKKEDESRVSQGLKPQFRVDQPAN
jgi:hypothetical protein